jgi:hypothetical protein
VRDERNVRVGNLGKVVRRDPSPNCLILEVSRDDTMNANGDDASQVCVTSVGSEHLSRPAVARVHVPPRPHEGLSMTP